MLTKSEKMSLNRAMVILIYDWGNKMKTFGNHWSTGSRRPVSHSGKQEQTSISKSHWPRPMMRMWSVRAIDIWVCMFFCFFFCFSSFLACHFFLFFPILALKTTGYFLLSIPFAHHNHHLLFSSLFTFVSALPIFRLHILLFLLHFLIFTIPTTIIITFLFSLFFFLLVFFFNIISSSLIIFLYKRFIYFFIPLNQK